MSYGVRTASLAAIKETICLILSRDVFRIYLGGNMTKMKEQQDFFNECFKMANKRIATSIFYLFQKKSFKIHDRICVRGEPANNIYIVSDGSIGVCLENEDKVKAKKF